MTSPIDSFIAELAPLFKQAREAHEQFQVDWDKNFPEMGQGYKQTALYQDQLNTMQRAERRIEDRILPVIEQLKSGVRTHIEVGLAYIAVQDQYFRSGYNKEAILKVLRRIDLSADDKSVLNDIWRSVQHSLSGSERREFLKLLETFHPSA